MKLSNIAVGAVLILFLYCVLAKRMESFKNLDNDAANELAKINQKILPHRATCINGNQCLSGRCLDNNNETTYGYCDKPIV